MKKYCSSCGKDNDPNAVFCSKCGTKFINFLDAILKKGSTPTKQAPTPSLSNARDTTNDDDDEDYDDEEHVQLDFDSLEESFAKGITIESYSPEQTKIKNVIGTATRGESLVRDKPKKLTPKQAQKMFQEHMSNKSGNNSSKEITSKIE